MPKLDSVPGATRPNVVFLLADDQGAWAMRCAGNGDIRTPNLDRLAASGIRFENFLCVSPVCSPARASLLTGRIPSRHGVHDWIQHGNVNPAELPEAMRSHGAFGAEGRTIKYLAGQRAYTEVLAENGYICGLSGKWHLGDSLRPQKGFSHWFTIARGGCDYFHPDIVRDGQVQFESTYITDLITEDALAFLTEREGRADPFYLSVHYTAPHSPWDREQHPTDLFDSYAGCAFEATPDLPLHPRQVHSCPHGTGQRRRDLLRGYYAAITAMDAGIGQILDCLEAMGLRENTLVFFTSDNGMNLGHHGIWGKGNGTFPLNMFDTSVKVPAIASQPGRIAEGIVSEALLSHYDFAPTLLDFLGLPTMADPALPGRSFAPLLRGEPFDEAERVVVFDEYGPTRMIRTREWKYVHRYPYGPHELYHLRRDPGELCNLLESGEPGPIINELRTELEVWFRQYADPALDGVHEAVYGSGQLDRAGIQGTGGPAFCGPHRYARGGHAGQFGLIPPAAP